MSKLKLKLGGVMPPVPTPFDARGAFDSNALRDNLQSLAATGLHGFVLLGSNGEYVYLDETEKADLFEVARRAIPHDKLFIAGTGAEATRTALRLTNIAAEAGADAAIIVTPCYYKPAMTGEALFQHYSTIADATPIPIILYNVPNYTGVDMAAETVIRLAAHPNIIGLKESSGNIVKISEITGAVAAQGLDFAVLAGSASFLQPTLLMGGAGGLGLYGGPVRPPLLPLAESAKPEIRQIVASLKLAAV
jgi:4-hydroxy-2-oxoglutarate aldolase